MPQCIRKGQDDYNHMQRQLNNKIIQRIKFFDVFFLFILIFMLLQGASIRANVGRSVGWSVDQSVCRKFVIEKIQIFLIIFWNCLERGCSVGLGVGGGGVRVMG